MPTVQRRGSERVALLTFQTLPSIATGESCVRDLSSQSEHQVSTIRKTSCHWRQFSPVPDTSANLFVGDQKLVKLTEAQSVG